MAIAKGQQSTEAAPRQLYIGVGAVKVLGVNPNKKDLEKFYGREIEKDPEYLSEVERDGKKYPSVRITFIVRTDPEKNNGIEMTSSHTFFLEKRYRQGSQSGKYQIIDAYGHTAWATKETIKDKAIPEYANGPANIDGDYRPAFVGEEALTLFIKNLLNIPSVQTYVNGEWIDNPKVAKEDCLVRLDKIEDYFKGDFSELVEIIGYQPDNLVKIPFGIRHTEDGKTYQTTYTEMSFKNAVTDFGKLDAEIQNRKANGGLATSDFDCGELKEYTVDPSTLEQPAEGDAAPAGDANPWD